MAQTPDAGTQHRFPCQQCGADYRFAPDQGDLLCDHCGDICELEPLSTPIREQDYFAALDPGLPDDEIEEIRTQQCPNCAAQIEFDESAHAAECPYCATPVVTDTGLHRHIKPKAVLPFVQSEDAARDALGRWLGRLWFAPNGVKQYAQRGRRLQGIYVPYWTYDADTKSKYRGQRGTIYYETRTVMRNGKSESQRVQKIRWAPASGRVTRFFDDVLVLASRSLPKRYADRLGPWSLEALTPYQPQYLAGFRAEGYTVDLDEGYIEARTIMDRIIERDVKSDIGGDRQRVSHVDTKISDVTFKHILLPIWLAAYKYRGKSYRFVVNGQSGEVQGERPYSAWKIAFAVVAGAIVASIIGYFIATNQ